MAPFYSTLQATFCDRHSRNRLVPEKRIGLILFTFLWVDKINVYQVRERGEAVQAVWFGLSGCAGRKGKAVLDVLDEFTGAFDGAPVIGIEV